MGVRNEGEEEIRGIRDGMMCDKEEMVRDEMKDAVRRSHREGNTCSTEVNIGLEITINLFNTHTRTHSPKSVGSLTAFLYWSNSTGFSNSKIAMSFLVD